MVKRSTLKRASICPSCGREMPARTEIIKVEDRRRAGGVINICHTCARRVAKLINELDEERL